MWHCCVQSGWHVLCSLRFQISEIPLKFVCGSWFCPNVSLCVCSVCYMQTHNMFLILQCMYKKRTQRQCNSARTWRTKECKMSEWENGAIQETGHTNSRCKPKRNQREQDKDACGWLWYCTAWSSIYTQRAHTHATYTHIFCYIYAMHTCTYACIAKLHVAHSGMITRNTYAYMYTCTKEQASGQSDTHRQTDRFNACNMQNPNALFQLTEWGEVRWQMNDRTNKKTTKDNKQKRRPAFGK